MIRTRAARRDDLPDVYRVLGAAFPHQPISLFKRQTERDSTFRLRHLRVAEVEGSVRAVVRIFARPMLVRGMPMRAGGVGSVAAHPDARGLGLPSALLRDAIEVMRRDGMALSFLFAGIPAFYERLSWRVVRQPGFEADAREAATMPVDGRYRLRRAGTDDVRAMFSVHRRATSGTTGAILRTERTWRDARTWLAEDAGGCLLAEHDGKPVAYLRARRREYGYQILEAEHAEEHSTAIPALLARAAGRAAALGLRLTTSAPGDHALAAALRTLPSTRESEDVQYPAMLRIVSLGALVSQLMPVVTLDRAEGPPFRLKFNAASDEALTLDVPSDREHAGPLSEYEFDCASTLDALLGQARASSLARPRPPQAAARRIDAMLPRTPFHFLNSDRI